MALIFLRADNVESIFSCACSPYVCLLLSILVCPFFNCVVCFIEVASCEFFECFGY